MFVIHEVSRRNEGMVWFRLTKGDMNDSCFISVRRCDLLMRHLGVESHQQLVGREIEDGGHVDVASCLDATIDLLEQRKRISVNAGQVTEYIAASLSMGVRPDFSHVDAESLVHALTTYFHSLESISAWCQQLASLVLTHTHGEATLHEEANNGERALYCVLRRVDAEDEHYKITFSNGIFSRL